METLKKLLESIFFETPIFRDVNKDMGTDKPANLRFYKTVKKDKTCKLMDRTKIGGYTLEFYSQTGGNVYIYLLTTIDFGDAIQDDVVGEMIGDRRKVTINDKSMLVMTISSMFINEEYQGKGLGPQVYDYAVNKFKKVMSDRTLTGEDGKGGSFQVWQKLTLKYPVYYLKRDEKDANVFTATRIAKLTAAEHMTQPNDRFLVALD